MDGFLLIRAEKAESVGLDEGRSLGFALPSRLGGVARALGQNDVIVIHRFRDQLLGVGGDFLESDHRGGSGKCRDDGGIPSLQVPEVVDVPVGKDDEAAVE